ARMDGFRERQRREVVATGLDHQPDHRAAVDVEHATLDQVTIDHRVEVRVVDDVVHVAVDVVVHPARGDWQEVPKVAANQRSRPGRFAWATLAATDAGTRGAVLQWFRSGHDPRLPLFAVPGVRQAANDTRLARSAPHPCIIRQRRVPERRRIFILFQCVMRLRGTQREFLLHSIKKCLTARPPSLKSGLLRCTNQCAEPSQPSPTYGHGESKWSPRPNSSCRSRKPPSKSSRAPRSRRSKASKSWPRSTSRPPKP